MNENWYALIIAMSLTVTPEQAFQLLDTGKKKPTRLDSQDILDMIKLRKEGEIYRNIGEIYGTSERGTVERIKYFCQKNHLVIDGDKLINIDSSKIICDVDEATPQQIKNILEG